MRLAELHQREKADKEGWRQHSPLQLLIPRVLTAQSLSPTCQGMKTEEEQEGLGRQDIRRGIP